MLFNLVFVQGILTYIYEFKFPTNIIIIIFIIMHLFVQLNRTLRNES